MLFGWCRNPIIAQARGFFNSTPQIRRFPAPSLRFRAVTGSQLFLIVSSQGRAARAALFFSPSAGRALLDANHRPAEGADTGRSQIPRHPGTDCASIRRRSEQGTLCAGLAEADAAPGADKPAHCRRIRKAESYSAIHGGYLQNKNRACATGRGRTALFAGSATGPGACQGLPVATRFLGLDWLPGLWQWGC